MTDEEMMAQALEQAYLALAEGETPVGCVIVKEGDLSPGAVTAGRRKRTPRPTRKWRPFAPRPGQRGIGG